MLRFLRFLTIFGFVATAGLGGLGTLGGFAGLAGPVAVGGLVASMAGPARAAPLPIAAARSYQSNFGELRAKALAEMKTARGVSTKTIRAIGKIKKPQARRLLIDILADARNDGQRATALQELAKREHASLRELFIRALDEAKSRTVATAAANGLARQESSGLDRLAKFATHLRKPIRDAAGAALASAARRNPQALPALSRFVRDVNENERSGPLAGLRNKPVTNEMLSVLEKVALSKHDASRAEALRQFAEAGQASKTRALLESVVASLAGREPSKTLSHAMLYAQAASVTDSGVDEFLYAALEADTALRGEMRRLDRSTKIRDRLVDTLASVRRKHEGPGERLVAVEILAMLRGENTENALIDALGDEATAVALMAVRELAVRKTPRALQSLKKLFRGRHEELQLESMLALHATQKNRKRNAWPAELREVLRTGTRVGLRCAAIDCLRDLGDERALDLVNDCARAPEWQLRSAAYRFLEGVANRESVQILVEQLQKEDGRLAGECLGALMLLTGKDYPRPSYWKQWWDNEGDSWTMPRPEKVAKSRGKKGVDEKKPKPRARALTYYDIPVTSNAASFLVDVSGSMRSRAGTAREPKIEAAKKALEQVLKLCEADRNFNIVPFSGRRMPWQDDLRPMNDKYRTQAIAFTRKLKAGGGTNIYAALRHAFDDGKVDTIYLLSDGNPTGGEIVDPKRLAAAVASWNRERRIVIHTIAFGAHNALLKQLATENGGQYRRYI